MQTVPGEQEAKALLSFPHLFLPDLMEAQIGRVATCSH
jgi:hypothetical protein